LQLVYCEFLGVLNPQMEQLELELEGLHATLYNISLATKLTFFIPFDVPQSTVLLCFVFSETRARRVGQCAGGSGLLLAAGEECEPIPARCA